jgi:hypothetical protein
MSNRKQSTASKPVFVKDRIDLAHRMQTSEGKPWGEYLDQAPVIHGGPQVTELSLNLLGSMRVTHWETYNHAKSRGVTVDRASGVEVMGHKQPPEALWGFTVYPMATTKPAPQKPASAKPKPVARAPIAKAKPERAPVAIKRTGKLGKLHSYNAQWLESVKRSLAGKGPKPKPGYQSSREVWAASRVPCSLTAMGISRKQQAESWNNYIKINPKCGLIGFDMSKVETVAEVTKANALYDGLANDRSTKEKRPRYLKRAA